MAMISEELDKLFRKSIEDLMPMVQIWQERFNKLHQAMLRLNPRFIELQEAIRRAEARKVHKAYGRKRKARQKRRRRR